MHDCEPNSEEEPAAQRDTCVVTRLTQCSFLDARGPAKDPFPRDAPSPSHLQAAGRPGCRLPGTSLPSAPTHQQERPSCWHWTVLRAGETQHEDIVSRSRSHNPGHLHSASPFFQVFIHVNQGAIGARSQVTWEKKSTPVSLTPSLSSQPPAHSISNARPGV